MYRNQLIYTISCRRFSQFDWLSCELGDKHANWDSELSLLHDVLSCVYIDMDPCINLYEMYRLLVRFENYPV